ncbi:MAG: methyltransferase domain-containing protein, partial [Acetobacter okinawensis]
MVQAPYNAIDISEFADQVLQTCGIAPTLLMGDADHLLASVLRSRLIATTIKSIENIEQEPLCADSWQTVVAYHQLDTWPESRVITFFSRLYASGIGNVVLRVAYHHSEGKDYRPREWWENRLVLAGFRKHPRYFRALSYNGLEWEGEAGTLVMERVPDASLTQFPFSQLLEERALHMDMARESGRRSDGHMVRYNHAAELVRPGDVVVDAACGLGYGSAMLAACSPAARVIGVDLSEFAVAYAQTNYGSATIEFHQSSADALNWLPDQSVDLFVSFETMEHVPDAMLLLREMHRVLKPSGRVIVSVPNLWVDETGEDPNPFHIRAYDLEGLTEQLDTFFLLETVSGQTAGGGFKHHGAPRHYWTIARGAQYDDAEWLIASAMKSPLPQPQIPYTETSFPQVSNPHFHVTAFSRDYENPWLFKSMISIPWRMANEKSLRTLATEVMADDTAVTDRAAALTVEGYALLGAPETTEEQIASFAATATTMLSALDSRPISVRWSVSLCFLLAQLARKQGDEAATCQWLEVCTTLNASLFSPILVIKTLEAYYQLGMMAIQKGQKDKALALWRQAIEAAHTTVKLDWLNVIGSIEAPLTFGLPELSQLLDIASRCAFAVDAAHFFEDRPGYFHDQINRDWSSVRQFGGRQAAQTQRMADARLLEITRLGHERQELYDAAEARLAEI